MVCCGSSKLNAGIIDLSQHIEQQTRQQCLDAKTFRYPEVWLLQGIEAMIDSDLLSHNNNCSEATFRDTLGDVVSLFSLIEMELLNLSCLYLRFGLFANRLRQFRACSAGCLSLLVIAIPSNAQNGNHFIYLAVFILS